MPLLLPGWGLLPLLPGRGLLPLLPGRGLLHLHLLLQPLLHDPG